MTTKKIRCPHQDELSKFSAGQLPSDLVDQIGTHVESCPKCSETLMLIAEKSDTLVSELRRSKDESELCSDADKDRVVKLIQKVGPVDSAKPTKKSPEPLPVPVALKKLVDDLSTTGLLSADEAAEVIQTLPAEKRDDAQELAKALIRQEKLTKFQATAVYQGKTKSLVFGEYVVLDKIGAGGMGTVYRARHRRMKREVAIKVLPGGSLDENAVGRFYQEVEAAAKLLHPNIVTAFDAGQHGRSHFLVMEYVEGQDLSELVKEKGQLPVAAAVGLVVQAARGLEYAHGEGLVHRDIKPANLLVDNKGTVKILDMGLARLSTAGVTDDGLTKSGQIMGTVDYMAPEQAADTRKADARADIYSLGCTLYRLLTGQPVFEGDTIMNKMMAHAQQQPPDLRTLAPDVSEQLNSVFQKMVAKSPDARQQSMTEVIADLEPYALASGDEQAGPNPWPAPSAQPADQESDSHLTEFFDEITPQPKGKPTSSDTGVIEHTIDVQTPATSGQGLQESIDDAVSSGDLAAATGHRSHLAPRDERSSRGARRLLLIATSLAGVIAVAAVVLTIRTPEGEVVVEIGEGVKPDEVKIEVSAGGNVKVIDAQSNWTINVAEGQYDVRLAGGADRFKLDKDSVLVTRNEKLRVRVTLKSPTDKTTTPSAGPAETRDDRSVARWLLSLPRTRMAFFVDDEYRVVDASSPLPAKGRITVQAVEQLDESGITDDDLARLTELKSLDRLSVFRTGISDRGVDHIAKIASLHYLSLGECRVVTDAALEKLKRLPKLAILRADATGITDASLKHVAEMSKLTELHVMNTKVSDAGLEHLWGMTNLKVLGVWKTKVTAAGVAKLHKALPQCRIAWTDGVIEPLPSTDPDRPLAETQLAGAWQPGPAENVLPGIIPRPAKLPGIGRWQILPMPQEAKVYLSPDGNYLAWISLAGDGNSFLVLQEAESRRTIGYLPLPNVTTHAPLAWHPQSTQLVVGDGPDIYTMDVQGASRIVQRIKNWVTSFAWSPAGDSLAIGGNLNSSIYLVAADGTTMSEIKTNTKGVDELGFVLKGSICGKR